MFENERNIFDNDLVIDLKDENGNSMIEATIVVTITLLALGLIIMLGFYHYQVALIQTIADEVATNISRTYPYESKDPISGFIGSGDLPERGLIESSYWIIGDVGFINDSKNTKEKNEAKALARAYMKKRRFLSAQGEMQVDVNIGHSELAVFQNEVRVTVSEEYYIPFAKLLGAEESVLKVSKSSKAICYDVMGARGYYQTLWEAAGILNDTGIGKALDTLTQIFDSVISTGGNLVNLLFSGG